MAQGLWLSLWLDFQGWLVVILIAAVVLMVGGGIFKSPVWWLIGYVARHSYSFRSPC